MLPCKPQQRKDVTMSKFNLTDKRGKITETRKLARIMKHIRQTSVATGEWVNGHSIRRYTDTIAMKAYNRVSGKKFFDV